MRIEFRTLFVGLFKSINDYNQIVVSELTVVELSPAIEEKTVATHGTHN